MKPTASGTERAIPAQRALTPHDIHLFREGTHGRLYERLGSHLVTTDGVAGVCFAVWAPNADAVSVFGDFNDWNRQRHPLRVREDGSGIWEAFVPGVGQGALYKYAIRSRWSGQEFEKGDPFAFAWQCPPGTASRVQSLDYRWDDGAWMAARRGANALDAPISIYEMHLGSWRREPEDANRYLS